MKNKFFIYIAFLFTISSCAIEISIPGDPVYVDSIAITNKINEIIVGNQYQFEPAYYPQEAEGFEMFTWQSSNISIATIDQNGLLTANNEGYVSIKLITVMPIRKGTVELEDMVSITVLPVEIESLQLNEDNLEIETGSTFALSVSIIPANAKSGEIEWSSNNEPVATVSNGVVTARNVGEAVITARVKGTDIKAECKVTVTPIEVKSIEFETKNYKLEVGEFAITKLIFVPANAANKNVIYSSSDDAIASVDAGGVIEAVSTGPAGPGTGPGTATITATSVVGGHQAICNVVVYSVPDTVTVSVIIKEVDLDKERITIIPTLHNNSSKPIGINNFRLMNRNDIYRIISIGTTLDALHSYTVNEDVVFNMILLEDEPRAEFSIEFDGQEYKRSVFIRY